MIVAWSALADPKNCVWPPEVASPAAVTSPLPTKALPSFVIVAAPAKELSLNNTTPPSLAHRYSAPVIDDRGIRRLRIAEKKQVARKAIGRYPALVDELPTTGLRHIVKNGPSAKGIGGLTGIVGGHAGTGVGRIMKFRDAALVKAVESGMPALVIVAAPAEALFEKTSCAPLVELEVDEITKIVFTPASALSMNSRLAPGYTFAGPVPRPIPAALRIASSP